MRHPALRNSALALSVAATALLAGCQNSGDAAAKRALDSVNVVDETNLNDVMLTVADPQEAVNYFTKASAAQPDRIDLKRGLAKSLVRAGQATQAIAVLNQIIASPEAGNEDRVNLAASNSPKTCALEVKGTMTTVNEVKTIKATRIEIKARR